MSDELVFRYAGTTRRGPKGKPLAGEEQDLFSEQGPDGCLVNQGWPNLTTGQAKALAEERGLVPRFVTWDGRPFYPHFNCDRTDRPRRKEKPCTSSKN